MLKEIRLQMLKDLTHAEDLHLASLAYGESVDFEDVYTEGITNITDVDFNIGK